MIKLELIQHISDKYGIKHTEAHAILRETFCFIRENVLLGNDVHFRDFGTFYLKEKEQRTIVHPRTKREVNVAARKAIGFKVSTRAIIINQ